MIRAVVAVVALALLAPATALADGELVQVAGADPVYRIVGGAPLWIGICDTRNNNCAGIQSVPNLDGYGAYPRDGALSAGGSDGGIYRWAGGAPLWISSCGYGPGCPDVVAIDDYAYDPARGPVRPFPVDGTVVRNVGDGGIYRFAGGAPLLVRCDLGVECSNPTQVDGGTFAELGALGARNTMRQYPVLGTTVRNVDTGAYFRFVGGAPLPLTSCAGCSAVPIDNRTFELLGTGTPSMPHMVATPPDHYFLTTGAATYRLAGGSAVQLTDCAPIGGCDGAVAVDAGTIASLPPTPRDGTVLRGMPSKRTWEIVAGKRRETFIPRVDAVEVDDGAINLLPVEAPPPAPPPPFTPVISSGYKVYRTYTRFTSLKVRNAPAGSVITVTCSGKKKRGCPFTKAKQYRLKGSSLDVRARWFKKAKLRNKASVTVRVTSPAGERKQQVFKIRSRKLPTRTTRCSAPGAKLGRCAT